MSLTLALLGLLVQGPADSARVLDDFESAGRWAALPSEGVALAIRPDSGRTGQAMRLDFDFQGHGGYAIARRVLDLALPENYEFSFWIRGDARPNTLEFKLADASGDNWWYTRPSYQFPHQWQKVTIKRRHIRFAWGPAGGGALRQAATLELGHRRPSGWRHWAEVVWQDPDTPKFIGDMPHTWVGSDFLRSVLDFFAYERDADDALVVGDGLSESWVMEDPGVVVRQLSTHYGRLTYSMRGKGARVTVRVAAGLRVPDGGIVVRSPRARPVRRALLNRQAAPVVGGREVVIRRLPAELTLWY